MWLEHAFSTLADTLRTGSREHSRWRVLGRVLFAGVALVGLAYLALLVTGLAATTPTTRAG